MPSAYPTPPLPDSCSTQVEAIVESFEAAWHRGERPRIDSHLPPAEGLRRAVLVGLVHADLEWRLKAGEDARAEEYLGRYADLAGDSDLAVPLIAAEFRLRHRREPSLSPEDYVRRFPEYAEAIGAHLRPTADAATPAKDSPRLDASSTATPATPSPLRPRPSADPATLCSAPRVRAIRGYELSEELGRGGMGVVYKARDLALKRDVALKMILGTVAVGAEELARFRTEAEVVARLRHPHIVQVFAGGEHEGRPYLVLEYVEGGTLAGKVRDEPQPPRDAARLVLLLARAAHHAHQQGIVHRDLKPANVLLAAAADEPALNTAFGYPKLTDFGLARCQDAACDRTLSGAVVGTPAYMAPEQAAGDRDAIGPATDVYALGVILYKLLTGRVPFKGTSSHATLEQVRTAPPPPPRQLRRDIPPDLETICLRCLRKAPTDRYPSAAALAHDLERFLADERIPKPPVARTSGTRWRWPAAAGAAALVLAGVLTWALWPSGAADGPARSPREGADVLPRQKGYIDVLINDPTNPKRQGLWLGQAGALPLRASDEVAVAVQLNRPTYAYVLWIEADGKVLPVYPWRDGKWEDRPARETPVQNLRQPEAPDEFFPLRGGGPGMETLVLLARDTPLPPAVDLRAELGKLPRQGEDDNRAVAWFEDCRVVRDEPGRGPKLDERRKGGHPVLVIQERLRLLQQRHFTWSRAVSFAALNR